MKPRRFLVVVVRTQLVVDLLWLALSIFGVMRGVRIDYWLVAMTFSHFAVTLALLLGARKIRTATAERWARGTDVLRQVALAWLLLLLLIVVQETGQDAAEAVSVLQSPLLVLFMFGIWLQAVGPGLSDCVLARQKVPGEVHGRRRGGFLISLFSLSIALDVALVLTEPPVHGDGPQVVLPAYLSHAVAMSFVVLRGVRVRRSGRGEFIRATEVGRQLFAAQILFFGISRWQLADPSEGMAQLGALLFELIAVGVWLLIAGPGKTAFDEALLQQNMASSAEPVGTDTPGQGPARKPQPDAAL